MTPLCIFCRLDDLNLELDTLKKQVEDLYPEIQSIDSRMLSRCQTQTTPVRIAAASDPHWGCFVWVWE